MLIAGRKEKGGTSGPRRRKSQCKERGGVFWMASIGELLSLGLEISIPNNCVIWQV